MIKYTHSYAPPQTGLDSNVATSRQQGISFGRVIVAALVGGMVAAVALYYLYGNDPRTGTPQGSSLISMVLGAGMGISGGIWAVAGAFMRQGFSSLTRAWLSGAVAVGVWILIFGTYVDVLAAAVYAGWPLGGLLDAVTRYKMLGVSTQAAPNP